jgi:hypothetical protein
MHLIRAIYVWPLPSPRAASEALALGRPRRSPAAQAAGAGGTPPKGLWPPAEPPTPCIPRVDDCALIFSARHRASGACRWRWRGVRACVLGAGVHVGQARGFVFVEVAPFLYFLGGGAAANCGLQVGRLQRIRSLSLPQPLLVVVGCSCSL